jgi:methionyl-tRNA synthetase
MNDRLFLTTAIPFVNGAPHLGHALEYVEADVLARHARARGRAVRFLTGTDEHAAKNVAAAAEAGRDVATFVADNARRFRDLADSLDISYDDFIRTSADARHRPAVEWLWNRCAANGDLYRATYGGWYCRGCEVFVDGTCDEHDAAPAWVEEENWFFRLSRYSARLREAIGSGELRILPEGRVNEVLAFLDRDVRDLSVSRVRSRVGDWGIPVPGDPSQLVYVWFDALANYVSALGLGGADDEYQRWWRGAGERRHVIGKGIVRFHAVIWPAILLSAGEPLPSTLDVHDYLTANGRKIGKSLGNAVSPAAIIETYGEDALRWWLACEVPRVGEADFSERRLVETANRDLANGLGNLVQRVVALAAKDAVGAAVPTEDAWPLLVACNSAAGAVDDALADFDIRGACGALRALVDEVNRAIERSRPWELSGVERAAAVSGLLEFTRRVVAEYEPFVPKLARQCRERLGTGDRRVQAGPPVAPRLELASA